MKLSRRLALNNFQKGRAAENIARSSELDMSRAASKVAGSSGIGDAVEYVRRTKEQKKAARKRQKQARRVNR
ncbi:MAG: hypothetical protein BWY85_00736 [Firmicutes bacterium ADurb.Bin506]|nr:MAG: hypothetical protein BWY85_00736 [Firmicutes bacterium ADurb.Bin506]